ncbi:MAG: DNA methyltransferase [Candidatus Aminicenantes bacterium]|nr:DNA methyltransferase [Candidatus Aminicenantes bacterium]
MTNIAFKQRSDYTFKFNRDLGRHGWLRLTPAYSVKLVEEILKDTDPGAQVIDPFAGTGTTPLYAGYHGFPAVGYELNPFLAWFGQVKSSLFSSDDIKNTASVSEELVDMISNNGISPAEPPPIYNIQRWWNPDELDYLCTLKAAIDKLHPASSKIKNLLLVAFCRLVIELSNAAFNHQSMSFKKTGSDQPSLFENREKFDSIFLGAVKLVLHSASRNPIVKPEISRCDSRFLDCGNQEKFDFLITSPPYPNRMSYIRELRPYMYWLGYLTNGRDAGELDWQAIGGTWGIATSRLSDWKRNPDSFCPGYLKDLLAGVSHKDNKNGQLMSNYIARYFEDMWLHIQAAAGKIIGGGCVHYIVGNSAFYNIIIPVERLFKDMLEQTGFSNVTIRTLRKRNSKKALFEFDVSGFKKN